jgi:hypothetical protein
MVQHVTTTDLQQPTIQTKVKEFKEAVKVRLLEENYVIEEPGFFYLDDDYDRIDGIVPPTDEEYGDMIQEPTPNVDDDETYDKYLNAEFVINRGNEPICVRVNKRAQTDSGNMIGQAHKNPNVQ